LPAEEGGLIDELILSTLQEQAMTLGATGSDQ